MSLSRLVPVLLTFTLAAPAGATVSAAAAAPGTDRAITRLRAEAKGRVAFTLHPATGAVRFARPEGRGARLSQPATKAKGAEARAGAFLARHGKAFGVERPGEELVLDRRQREPSGASHVSFRQVHRGVPVFGAMLRVHLDARGAVVVVNGTLVPSPGVDVEPTIDAGEAARLVDGLAGADILERGSGPRLVVFRAGLVRGIPGPSHLAWEVPVGAAAVREHVYVDAHTGKVVDRIDVSPEALHREAYLASPTAANLKWSEGQPLPYTGSTASQNDAINKLLDYTKDAYDFFAAFAERDSWNGAGAPMKVVYESASIAELCPNATWNGSVTNYCVNVTADDVVAHEWGHAYTTGTHGLIYQWQSGALNESYADIWGETVDRLNGAGHDAPEAARSANGACTIYVGGGSENNVRWLFGEKTSGTAGRDMWNPNCSNDPARVNDAKYHCFSTDNGGVHINSGVSNHAYALLVDGGTFNGRTIGAIGLVKATHVYFRAADVYQTPTTDFADHADALEQSCRDLQGAATNLRNLSDGAPSGEVISGDDCEQVELAIAAVELRAEAPCDFEPILAASAPPLCNSGSPVTAFSETFEAGFGSWQRSHEGVYAEYDPLDWQIEASLPSGRAGRAAFAFDTVNVGDCVPGSDDQSGVMRLTSPTITAPADRASPFVAFTHYVATEPLFDGGNLKVSVDGGEFQVVPESAFRFNPYNDEIEISPNDNPIAGEPAFTGTDGGSFKGSWGQSQVDLGSLVEPGDQFRLRYDFGVDGCNGVDGWYVDDVQVYTCSGGSSAPCVADDDTLCLLGGRYRVELDWENQFDGSRGRGIAQRASDFAGMFAFTDPKNVEMMVKLLDFGSVIKAFYGQLTNLRFTMRVTDTRTGATKTYSNTPSNCGGIDQAAFSKSVLADGAGALVKAGNCTPNANALCLLDGRFRVEVDWANQYNGTSGRGGAERLSDLSGTFSFGDPRNTELLAKALDFGDRILFIYGALTDLGYTLRVTDTGTGAVKTYENPPGMYCGGLDDSAF